MLVIDLHGARRTTHERLGYAVNLSTQECVTALGFGSPE